RSALLRLRQFQALPPELNQGLVEMLADAAAELWPEAPPLLEDLRDAQLKRVVERALESCP
ncbi:hypothetical protein, partial [Methylorubrum suomiense]